MEVEVERAEIPILSARRSFPRVPRVESFPFSLYVEQFIEFSYILPFSHFCTLLVGFRNNDDFELFCFNLEF